MSEAEQVAQLTQWVRQHSESLLRLCFIQLADRALAEDALQETFIKAWKAMSGSPDDAIRNERAWLSRIALNVCRDIRRTRWMRHVDFSKALEDLPPTLVAVHPEDRTLLMDIHRLPDKYRQVLLLYYYQHLTLREVGEVLSLDSSTVHYRLKKAQQCLKRQLTEEVDAP